jgi:YD repeat-containing protein
MRSKIGRGLLVSTTVLALLFGALSAHATEVNYFYDELNRLIRVESQGVTLVQYGYDNAGNRIGISSASDTTPPITWAEPAQGAYNSAINVTLTCYDGIGSGCASIYYTTDGTSPTTASPVYSAPISISVPTTLQFFAVDGVGNAEEVRTQSYTFDTTLPTGTILIAAGAAYTNNAGVDVSLTCSDVAGCAQMKFSNDNVSYSTPEAFNVTRVWSLPSGDGVKTIYVRFMDSAGNWSNPASDTITLDTTCSNPFIRIGSTSYPTLQAAYDAAMEGQTIQSRYGPFPESLTLNRNINVTFDGGYNCGFTAPNGMTILNGNITGTSGTGTTTISNFDIE